MRYTYSVGYDLASPLTLGGGPYDRASIVAKARESLAYYAQPDVRGSRCAPLAEVTLHCAECDGEGCIVLGGAREMRKPLWARRTKPCPVCHGCGAILSEVVR